MSNRVSHTVSTIVIAVAAFVAIAVSPLFAGTAVAAPAVCLTDGECAVWTAQHYTLPKANKVGDLRCSKSRELFDTKDVDMGVHGMVCRPKPRV